MAFKPKGVAALPMPSRLADIFIKMAKKAGLSRGTSGKISRTTGPSSLPTQATRPDFSATFIRPVQRQIMPQSSRISLGVFSAEAKSAVLSASVLPEMAAKIIPAATSMNQNQLIIRITRKTYAAAIRSMPCQGQPSQVWPRPIRAARR
ncbi:hypothetical protein SDC9_193108 [bioreactor metagenome]|uniref:Uncharacterized protein n=1 Tax=bioreactor metagenome TaxID=1076179 RepID=A0A645I2L4_9ZZZZ